MQLSIVNPFGRYPLLGLVDKVAHSLVRKKLTGRPMAKNHALMYYSET